MEISTMAVVSTLFPGFKFSPSDEQLISYYLKRKMEGLEKSVEVIPEVDICKFEPWDLPAKSIIQSDHEWFFFSPRGRKYPNGSQTRRTTEVGYWKATGKERDINSSSSEIGTKRTLVFHMGRAPKGERTDWIIHEYCLKGNRFDGCQDFFSVCRLRKKHDLSVKNDSPNDESESHMGLPPINVGLCSASQVGSDIQHSQMGVCGEAMECCSKNQSSGLVFPSVEQSDSTSESVQKQRNESCSPTLVSAISQEAHDTKSLEEDCFADILKDDIIKLDYSSLPRTPSLLPLPLPIVAEKAVTRRISEQPVDMCMSRMQALQGTAHRRIRLKIQRPGHYLPETLEVGGEGSAATVIQGNATQSVKDLKSKFSVCSINCRMVLTVSVIMTLLVLFLLLLRGTLYFKMVKSIIKL